MLICLALAARNRAICSLASSFEKESLVGDCLELDTVDGDELLSDCLRND